MKVNKLCPPTAEKKEKKQPKENWEKKAIKLLYSKIKRMLNQAAHHAMVASFAAAKFVVKLAAARKQFNCVDKASRRRRLGPSVRPSLAGLRGQPFLGSSRHRAQLLRKVGVASIGSQLLPRAARPTWLLNQGRLDANCAASRFMCAFLRDRHAVWQQLSAVREKGCRRADIGPSRVSRVPSAMPWERGSEGARCMH